MPDFDPASHLITLKGKEYLEVKWRLVWFRQDHPDGQIDTHLVEHEADHHAIVHAHIRTPDGGSATGMKREDKQHFGDYLEKAETGAIGRALAGLGYGTQFAPEMDNDSMDDPVDAPVATAKEKTSYEKARDALFARIPELGIERSQIHQWAVALDDHAYNTTSQVPERHLRSLLSDFRNPANVQRFKDKFPRPEAPLPTDVMPAD
jgi:hypothetical protein